MTNLAVPEDDLAPTHGVWPDVSESRRRMMRKVRRRDTSPETVVRTVAHQLGYRFRLHVSALPGRPDLVFPGRTKVIFVHGCFWHQHNACRKGKIPRTRSMWWRSKLARNRERDAANQAALEGQGWRALVIWECEVRDSRELANVIGDFLGERGRQVPLRCTGPNLFPHTVGGASR